MKHYPVLQPTIGAREKKYVNECLDSGWISSGGKYVQKFERAFAHFKGIRYAATTFNGTVSLHLILVALGIGKGDEVIVPDFTYVATANAVLYVGAHPVFVDCDKTTYNINPDLIEKKINKKTRAIMVTHLYGNPCDMDKIMRIAKKYKLAVIEDAAEAHGAIYKGKMTGTFGVAGSYSFFGNKIMTTGEGGMVITKSKKIYDTIALLRNQGQNPRHRRYFHDRLAYNYRMTNLQAAVGLAQLEQLNTFLKQKRLIHAWYKEFLSPLVKKGLIVFQEETPKSKSSWWVTTIRILRGSSEKLAETLLKKGVETRPFFYPMHKLPHLKQKGYFPSSEKLAKEGLILPSSTLLSKKDIQYIGNIIVKAILKETK